MSAAHWDCYLRAKLAFPSLIITLIKSGSVDRLGAKKQVGVIGTSVETEAPGVCEHFSCQRRCLKSQTAVALIWTDVPKGEGNNSIVRHSDSPVWRRARLLCNSFGQRRKEVMLSDLSVNSRHNQSLGDKLEVCFKRCVKSVLGPHHSREIVQRGTKTKVKCQQEEEERLTYDLFKSKCLETMNNYMSVHPCVIF